eukprot:CAMPEP_0168527216 /NCGR_PEP_ID=MMETSP0405-20121227/12462_1 /TAXON_ID=498012 /ORGANISM="Trichosphaerium sp, Strain Am-I-7 wt" /LENGTH=154 /DNA_ID=CAMNT_0008550269 /DNA_START=198 /DNA_END=659 /DNA_ORIENTATION=+
MTKIHLDTCNEKKNKEQKPTDPLELFNLEYDECLRKFCGKNTRPVLYALCMATVLQLGVLPVREICFHEQLFQVTNHESFMLALNVFSSEKRKRPTNAYSTYRSLSRWVKMLDTRKKGRAWRFTVRANEKARWAAVTKEVRNMLAIERLVEWEW